MQQDGIKNAVMIGGPNGAGKTSWAYRHLPPALEIRKFVNADEIARGISPLDPESSAIAAGRLMLDRLNIIAERQQGTELIVHDAGRWSQIEEATR